MSPRPAPRGFSEEGLRNRLSMLNMPPQERRIHMSDRRKEAYKLFKKGRMTARDLAKATGVTPASAQHLISTMLPEGRIESFYLPGTNGAKTYGIKRAVKANSLEACPSTIHRLSGDPEDCSKFQTADPIPPEWELQAIFFGHGPVIVPVREFAPEPAAPQGFMGWTRKTEKEE